MITKAIFKAGKDKKGQWRMFVRQGDKGHYTWTSYRPEVYKSRQAVINAMPAEVKKWNDSSKRSFTIII